MVTPAAEVHRIRPPTVFARPARRVSVVIPARNEAHAIGRVIGAVRAQRTRGLDVEVVVVDDGSTDGTAAAAERAGARTLRLTQGGAPAGNPAAARNRGAQIASGDPIVFLDADCTPAAGWLPALLAAHDAGAVIVGGSLALPSGLPASARCDYYCGWYHVHPRRPAGYVANHPPGNISVRRAALLGTTGFTEEQPVAYAHEELAWQAALARAGYPILFEPRAVVEHHNRPGFTNLLRRNYRWAYSAIESKAETGAARLPRLYQFPRLLIALSVPIAITQTAYIIGCWARARTFEPLLMLPAVLAARLAYAAGMTVGGIRWLRHRERPGARRRPRWE